MTEHEQQTLTVMINQGFEAELEPFNKNSADTSKDH